MTPGLQPGSYPDTIELPGLMKVRRQMQLNDSFEPLQQRGVPSSRWAGIWKRCQMFTANCSEWRASDVVGRTAPGKTRREYMTVFLLQRSRSGRRP
jgi:hypothetical protein